MRRFRWISATALSLALGLGIFTLRATGAKPADNVATVTRQDLSTKITVAGTCLPFRRTMFTPPYNAYIRKIHVKLGDDVRANDPVVTLTQTSRGAGEDVYPLRAPFAGRVVQVLKTEGEYVEANKDNSGMVRIDDLSRVLVYSDVPEADIVKIRPGQEVFIKANAIQGRTYKGVIREMSLAAKEKKEGWSRTGDRVEFEVHIEVTDKDEQLKPGMSAIVDIVTESRKAVLTLPHEYVQRENDKYVVTLETGEKRQVEVGAQNDEALEIKRGLAESERVKMVDFFSLPKAN